MPDRWRRGGIALVLMLWAAAAGASQTFRAQGEIELAFSPWDDPEALLLGVIKGARKSLRVQAYALTSKKFADALVVAHRRGVRVEVLADGDMNRRDKGNVVPRLLAAGVPVAFETRYRAAHNKVLIADAEGPGCNVVTGSYNFTWSAQNRNSENLLVLRGHCPLARAYRDNWLRHRAQATPITRLPWKP
ncbi:MAG: phospholipase D family protein [Azoarcus sp.]|nr:phospholipase D family protein [Azoarcus sp.]